MYNVYKDDFFTYKDFKNIKERVIVGIDEAGRGPVLGHLVYGALIAKTVNHSFMDSKLLTAAKRETFFGEIQKNYSYIYTAIHPKYLSNQMELCTSLNEISYRAVIDLLTEINKEYDIETVYLDALGPNETYRKRLTTALPNLKYVIESKADTKYKIVSGASIVAKCVRDKILFEWDLKDKQTGCGYPGDEVTVKWLKNNYCPVFGFSNIVRFSWKTIKNMHHTRNGKRLTGKYSCFSLQK
ncbi:hypothetical protein BDAP_000024 [Binucleata daphniae]